MCTLGTTTKCTEVYYQQPHPSPSLLVKYADRGLREVGGEMTLNHDLVGSNAIQLLQW